MDDTDNWYEAAGLEQVDSPALIVYPERVQANIALLKNMVGEPSKLRPHVKTHKSKNVVMLMLEADIDRFKCATIAEAEMLGMCKTADVLMAYQPTLPKLLQFVRLIKNYPQTRFSCLIDNKMTARLISRVAMSEELVIPVYLDLNVGMGRTGIEPGTRARYAISWYKRVIPSLC